jgi:succinate-semialdehyde dehydrogenase / glutarate-semialdehyde dehydrogenase
MTTLPNPLPTGLFIAGQWRDGACGRTFDVVDPATEEVLEDRVAIAEASDVEAALESAAAGFVAWRAVDAWTRSATLRRVSEILRAWAPEMASVLTAEQGKPRTEALSEIAAAADQFDWSADEARRIYGRTIDGHSRDNRLFVTREPVGVVSAFTAWNFPALLPARKIAPALAAGCALIVKPAEEAPLTTLLLAAACAEAGLPPGALNMLTGDPAAISDQLIHSEIVRKVSLTGSVPVGKTLLHAAADGVKSVSMELGGHAPVLVFEDADIELAATASAQGKFRNAGQVCASPSRFLVAESVAEKFVARFAAIAQALRVGDGRDPDTQVGPLINAQRLTAAESFVEDAVTRGAAVAAGGGRDPSRPRGYFFRPTVLTDVRDDMVIMREEPFAPVAPVATFADLGEALALANSTPFGLASFVFTRDLRTAWLASEGLDAGMVGVNTMLIATAEAPFGGVKHSGFGREGGSEGVEDYTVAKYINMAL